MRLCGLDEVGRGALAGPIVAAAVVFPPDFDFAESFPALRLGDSKKLTVLQRERTYEALLSRALIWQIALIDVPQIDSEGIAWANRAIFEQLIESIDADRYIVDGNLKLRLSPSRAEKVRCLIRADQSEPAVSAASIVAKVTRDRLMRARHAEYPMYDWLHNVGYGTEPHCAALTTYGRSPQHRRQFADTAIRHYQEKQIASQPH